MNAVTKATLERTRQKLRASGVDALTMEHTERALDCSAEATNGTPDKIQAVSQTLHELTVAFANFVADAPAFSEAAARRAVSECPMRAAHMEPKPEHAPTGRLAIVRDWAIAVRPIAWPVAFPVAIIGAAGRLPSVIEAIKSLF